MHYTDAQIRVLKTKGKIISPPFHTLLCSWVER